MTPQSFGAAAYARERQARALNEPRLDLAALVGSLQDRQTTTGRNAEFVQEYARRTGGNADLGRPAVPVEMLLNPHLGLDELLLNRDMTAAGALGSNYLATNVNQPVVDALRPYSVSLSAGVEVVIATGTGNQIYPLEAAPAAAGWLANELTAITESQPTIGQGVARPHAAGIYLEASRLFMLQNHADAWLRRTLTRSITELIDAAILTGTGTGGQPTGIANTSGVTSIDGTGLAIADINDAIYTARTAGLDQREVAFIAGAAAERVLRNRETASGSGVYLWSGNALAGLPAFGTKTCPTNSLLAGPWGNVRLVLWGDATVEVNPYANFQAGLVAMRILIGADVVVGYPSGFGYAASVS